MVGSLTSSGLACSRASPRVLHTASGAFGGWRIARHAEVLPTCSARHLPELDASLETFYKKQSVNGCSLTSSSQTRQYSTEHSRLNPRCPLHLKMPQLTAAQLEQHPELPHVTWPLQPTQRGKVTVAHGRGGPFNIAYEIHGRGPKLLLVSLNLPPRTPRIHTIPAEPR